MMLYDLRRVGADAQGMAFPGESAFLVPKEFALQ
jgi:hypothetical protein